jgi:hypothetical protein
MVEAGNGHLSLAMGRRVAGAAGRLPADVGIVLDREIAAALELHYRPPRRGQVHHPGSARP